jgi:hypothetical protein
VNYIVRLFKSRIGYLIFLLPLSAFIVSCGDGSSRIKGYDTKEIFSKNTFGPGTHYTLIIYYGSNTHLINGGIVWVKCEALQRRYASLIESYSKLLGESRVNQVAVVSGPLFNNVFVKLDVDHSVWFEINEWDEDFSIDRESDASRLVCQ